MDDRATAYYEAGHVVAGSVLEIKVIIATIVGSKAGRYKGFTGFQGIMTEPYHYSQEVEDWMQKCPSPVEAMQKVRARVMLEATMFMAGPVAQKLFTGECPEAIWELDAQRTQIKRIASGPEEERGLISQVSDQAEDVLCRNRPSVETVAKSLLDYKTLDREQLERALEGGSEGRA